MPTQPTTNHSEDGSAENAPADGRPDFDFFFGRWNVSHRRLQKRLQDDTNWDVFGGTCDVRPILGGLGNVDDNVIELPVEAYRAATLRTFDPATSQWSIWWIDGRNPATIDIPMRGTFEAGVGTFLCKDVFDGRNIYVRFLWSRITEKSARWEQAFFTGCRQDLGDQLDHGFRPASVGGRSTWKAFFQAEAWISMG
ncbi:DUF1579 domain-containing protein [Mesorhizobium sp.]|uniref:DUF1579 domain-containing protein n=1 Tax=Mesorhizobium sp. TaxID=1871066 RepID=UPI002580F1D7|nr:DUF1579 domain-containing protein [Mesorhizobium sp.]